MESSCWLITDSMHVHITLPPGRKKKIPRGAMPKGGDNEQRKSKDSVKKLLSALIHCHPHVRCCCYSLDLGSKGFWIPEGCFTMRLS